MKYKSIHFMSVVLRFAPFLQLLFFASGIGRADFVDAPENQPPAEEKPAPFIPRGGQGEDVKKPAAKEKSLSPEKPKDSEKKQPVQGQKSNPKRGGLLSDDVTQHDDTAPIQVKGDIVKGLRTMGRLDLEGNVEILQSGAKLLSDAAIILTDPDSSRTKKAIARGNVKFSKESTINAPPLKAEAEEMEYLVPERKIVMTGQPRVWRGQELIQGKQITLDLDTGAVTIRDARGVVEPSNISEQDR